MTSRVRVANAADAGAIAAIYAPYVRETAISFEQTAPGADEMAARMAATLATYPYLVAEGPGGVLGYAYAGAFAARAAYRWSVEVSIYVAGRAHGAGVGRALYGELLRILGRQGFHAAFAGIALPNPGSIAFHERLGFSPAGVFVEAGFKQGAWHDVGWWRRALEGAATPPAEPTPFPRLAPPAA